MYLGQGSVTHRFSLQFAGDYLPISSAEFFDPGLSSDVRIREELGVFNPALGFDILQTSRVDLTVRYGGAAVGNFTRLLLRERTGSFEDVCNLEAFEESCPTRWSLLGNAGVSFRIFPRENGRFYFGADYTRFATAKNQFVGTFGWAF